MRRVPCPDHVRNVRNKYSNLIKENKNHFIEKQIEQQDSPKAMWKVLKGLINDNKSKQIKPIVFQNSKIDNNIVIAQEFNRYFVESIQMLNKSIPNISFLENEINKPESNFKFRAVTLKELNECVKNMKDKTSGDEFTMKILKDLWPIIEDVMLNIINESLATGIFPENWKTSTIIPIPKVKPTKKCDEFRPINMLPCYEKILEKVVKIQLEEYLEKNKILSNSQSGFRSQHSCETALNMVLVEWKSEIENNKFVVSIFLDLKRAFETIDRQKLLIKLDSYGISGGANKWFENYLHQRKQKTRFNEETSEAIQNDLGVPQGSILGPLLFIIYINDLELNVKYCKVNLFADDTLLSVASDNLDSAIDKMNSDLEIISKWLKVNKLKLNIQKTKCMIIGNKQIETFQTPKVTIDNEDIEIVREFKYLGIIVDNKLKFNSNIEFIIKKVSKKISFFSRVSTKLSIFHRILIYKSIISPHFDYCATILFLANEQQIHRLQIQQNKAMRIILHCSRYTPIKLMLDVLHWLSIRQRIIYFVLLLIFKTKNGQVPMYLKNNLNYNNEIHEYNTRIKNDFRLNLVKKTCTQNCVFWKGLKIYNKLPEMAKQSTNIYVFKRECVDFIRKNY